MKDFLVWKKDISWPKKWIYIYILYLWLVAQWLALHSRPVFRDGFLLAYTMWCWNSCWVGSALSFSVGFSSNSKKEAPIGVLGSSIRSVPTLMGEGNTHTHTHVWSCMVMYGHTWVWMVMYGIWSWSWSCIVMYDVWLIMVLYGHKMNCKKAHSFETKESNLLTAGSKCW